MMPLVTSTRTSTKSGWWHNWSMPKRDPTQEQLERLSLIEAEGDSPKNVAEARKRLSSKRSLVAARAVEILAAWHRKEIVSELVEMFDRFMIDPVKSDPNCAVKTAIAKALVALDYREPAIYLRGLRHEQWEPRWGLPEDTAGELRGACGRALAAYGHPDALCALTDLLADHAPEARLAAVTALRTIGDETSELLLRLRLRVGEEVAAVATDAFAALIDMAPERSLPFVKAELCRPARRAIHDEDDDVAAMAVAAALALGESHLPEAFSVLRQCWDSPAWMGRRESLLMPMALLRSEESFRFLIEVLKEERPDEAAEAVRALHLFDDETHRDAIESAVAGRTEGKVKRAWAAAFEE